MRADAARNLEAVLLTGARVLAADPTASMAEIARESGVALSILFNFRAGKSDIALKNADKLCKFFGLSLKPDEGGKGR